MSETIKPERSDSDELADVETRRTFLTSLAMNDAHALLTEGRGHSETEAIWLAFRAVALELVSTSIKVMELEDRANIAEVVAKPNGAMLAGLLGLKESGYAAGDDGALSQAGLDALTDEEKARRFNLIVYRTGATVREASGLESVGA